MQQQRDTSLDNDRSKVYGTKRIYSTTKAIEDKATIADADKHLEAAEAAASHAVAQAIQAGENAESARIRAAETRVKEQQEAAEKADQEARHKQAQEEAAEVVSAIVKKAVGGADPVFEHDSTGPDVPDETEPDGESDDMPTTRKKPFGGKTKKKE